MAEIASCASCSAPIEAEELAQGLAVKVSGRLLCPLCLEHLPGDAQVLVNQMRALRGMAVTTYRYYSGRHPGLPLFTFTTAAMLLGHRHKLAHGEPFEAPPLPPPDSRPRLPSAAEAARGERTGWIAVAGVTVLVLSGIVWLAMPTGGTKPPKPKPAPVAQQPAPPKPPETDARNPAGELAELRRRLREHPDEAQAVADAAEILRDGLPPRELALRDGAEALAREAQAVVAARKPTPEPQPQPQPQPEAPQAPPETPKVPEPDPVAVVPKPTPEPIDTTPPWTVPPSEAPPANDPPVVAKPTPEKPTPEKPSKPSKPPKASPAEICEVALVLPKAKPVIEPGLMPKDKALAGVWPWPSGVPIHAPALDAKQKSKRLVMEVRLPGVASAGGATLVIHPNRADRQLSAWWTDGTGSTPPQVVALNGHRWQTIAIPAIGSETLADQANLRLRLEDVQELGADRPFLVAGASTRSIGAPLPGDIAPGLPLFWPKSFEAIDGWKTFREALRRTTGKLTEDRPFAFAKAKVLLPFNNQGQRFRTALRTELAAMLKLDKLANGNPDELPWKNPDFASGIAGWPADGMGDLSSYPALVFGWRAYAWGAESDLPVRLRNLLSKMLTPDKRLRRTAIVPVLAIGEIDFASAEESKKIDAFWLEQALLWSERGVPMIDLRSAQQATGTEQIQQRAAMLLADGLRQLDWINRL